MKIKKLNLYTGILYIMLSAYMLAPALAYKIGIPRVDNPLTLLFVLLGIFLFCTDNKFFPQKILSMLGALSLLSLWPGIHILITPLSPTQLMDILFFMVLPVFFYLFYQILIRADDPVGLIQKFLLLFALYVAVPPFIELATGIQFVTASEELSIDDGSLKGLFFNPNNLAATAVCLAPAILFFFLLEGRSRKERLYGWGLFLLLGMAIFASVSRTAIGCYLLILFVYTAYRKNGFITVGIAAAIFILFALLPDRLIQEFLLSLNGNQFLERFSSRVYLFLYDLGSDNSVSYRQEIYRYFWEHPPLLAAGFGPKNFGEYFGGHLSNNLAFENPHSFIIELYLGFGILSLFGFFAFIGLYCKNTGLSRALQPKSRILALVCMGIFLLAGFIPSTILRMPFIWLPCILVYLYSTTVLPRLREDFAYTYAHNTKSTS